MTESLKEIYVIGAGGHGKTAIRAAQACGIRVVAVFDDDPEKVGHSVCGVRIAGDLRSLHQHPRRPTLIAIGDNIQRLAIAKQLPLPWATIVHPTAIVDPDVRLGPGTLVLAGAVIQVDASVGEHVIVNDNATIEHDCQVGSGAHVSCNACLTGGASVGSGAMIGAGAVVLPNLIVGDFATVGAGAVVTRNVSNGYSVAGIPARALRQPTAGPVASPASQSSNRIYLSPPHMSSRERELLLDAFDSNWIAPLGPQVDAFEREFAAMVGSTHAVALSSGTAALHLALLAVGVQPGDEVLVSTLTFVATVNAIRYCGATPVFIDSERKSWNLNPTLVEEELGDCAERGRLPAAVVAVDIFGQCADYDTINDVCGRYGVPVIEDAAESLGAKYRGHHAGTLASVGCFSFNGNKIITTSGGGMLVTENAGWADSVRHLSCQARLPGPHYNHDRVGYNYRLSNLLAAVGRGQLRTLDDRVAKRRELFVTYHNGLCDLPGLTFMPEFDGSESSRWLTCILVEPGQFGRSAEDIRLHLDSQNIESRIVWKPMHLQSANAGYRVRGGSVAEGIFQQGLCLPSGSNLTATDVSRVLRCLRECAGRKLLQRAG